MPTFGLRAKCSSISRSTCRKSRSYLVRTIVKLMSQPPEEEGPGPHSEKSKRRCVFVVLFVEGVEEVKCVCGQFPSGLGHLSYTCSPPFSVPPDQVSILDSKRAMNIAIFLKQFKR